MAAVFQVDELEQGEVFVQMVDYAKEFVVVMHGGEQCCSGVELHFGGAITQRMALYEGKVQIEHIEAIASAVGQILLPAWQITDVFKVDVSGQRKGMF